MSYDMEIGDAEFNFTYNVSPMWYDCYPEKGIRTHYGLTGDEAVPVLRKLRTHMEDNRGRLEEMNPKNGWGSYETALVFVNRLIIASILYHDEVWDGD